MSIPIERLLAKVKSGVVYKWSETYEWNTRQIDELVDAGVFEWKETAQGERLSIGYLSRCGEHHKPVHAQAEEEAANVALRGPEGLL